MIFRKDIDPRCTYCEHSRQLRENEMSCPKYGVVTPGYSCRAFRYDPTKRVPPKPVRLKKSPF